MRLGHVIDTVRIAKAKDELVPNDVVTLDLSDMPVLLSAMIEDVEREAKGEIVESKDVRRAISAKTAAMFKAMLAERGS